MKLYQQYPVGAVIWQASCLFCPRREPLIVTEHFLEEGGQLAVCASCVAKMASLIGWVSPQRAETLTSEHRAKVELVAALQAELRSAKQLVATQAEHLSRYARDLPTAPPTPADGGAVSVCPDCGAQVARRAYGAHRRHCKAAATARGA